MVFSSVPLYLESHNWQQHPNQHQHQHQHQLQLLQGNGSHTGDCEIINSNNNNNNNNNHQQHPLPPPPLAHHHHAQVALGGGGGGPAPSSIRPNSMAEQARKARIPPPEAPLKCPRCDSSNTKFCYYNNYNLSQPRHFCKACRRYWTRGGALRNVPVGGGCRRNKRSSSSKSSSSSASTTAATSATLSKPSVSLSSAIGGIIPSGGGFMASLHNITQLGMGNLGLNFSHNNPLIDQHQLNNYGSTTNNMNINSLLNQHRHQVPSFPNFLGGFEIPGSSSSFQNVIDNDENDGNEQVGDKSTSNSMTTNIMSSMMLGSSANSSHEMVVKMEDNNRQVGLNLEKGLLMGITSADLNATSTTVNSNSNNNNNNQFWGSNNMWSTTTSTTTNLM